jgi:hypothetical protein
MIKAESRHKTAKITRIIAGAICFFVVFSAFMAGGGEEVFAAPSSTYRSGDPQISSRKVDELARSLEAKYGITIYYPVESAGEEFLAGIVPETLHTLDAALETITPAVVRQVSAYLYEKTGRRLTYNYAYADMRGPFGNNSQINSVTVGSYDARTARINIYIPMHAGRAVANGDNPLTIAHEFGHAFLDYISSKHGSLPIERAWYVFMDGRGYGRGSFDQHTFITRYAMTSFEEDFAETFAHTFICNRPGLGFSYRLHRDRETPTPLGRKIGYIEGMLERYFTGSEAAVLNLRKIYTTPASTTEAGLKLSGMHLIFIGMDEPRSVPLMLLNNLPISERGTVWFPAIGGWYASSELNGEHFVLFPEGTFGDPGRDLQNEALAAQRARAAG